MHLTSMRSNGTKTFSNKIELMKWSNRMDCIAFSNEKGEVIVQRMNWQNLWIRPAPADNVKVRGIDWRSDERILAIGYSNGLVVVLDVENYQEINTFNLESDISTVSWTQNVTEIQDDIEDPENRLFHNSFDIYLPSLPSFNALSSNARKVDYNAAKSYSNKTFNVLIVGLKSGIIHTSVFGVLACGRIDICKYLNTSPENFQIVDVKMNSDFRLTFILVRVQTKLKMLIYENDVIPNRAYPLLNVATKHGHILNLMAYIDDIIQCITEAWETALLEMDNKLTKYASFQPDGTVSADFLELLMFGIPSAALEIFLTRDLTEKGLKKLGNSIEISYSTIQQLVIKPLHTGIMNICYHLNSITGMSKNVYYYQSILGKPTNEVTRNAAAFLIKSLELQHAIEQSTRDYKIFWGWLYGVIIRLMDENVPEEVTNVTQQDVIYLAEFLNNFDINVEKDEDGQPVKKKFNLERVGQYLENKNLQNPVKVDLISDWNKLLEENECLHKSSSIFPRHNELSLIQEHNLLKTSITALFSKPEKLIGDATKFQRCIDLLDIESSDDILTHHVNVKDMNLSRFTISIGNKHLHFIEFNPTTEFIHVSRIEFERKTDLSEQFRNVGSLNVCHTQFYNENIISILMHNADDQNSNCFVQFPIRAVQFQMVGYKLTDFLDLSATPNRVNFYDIVDPQSIRTLELSDGHRVAVSGERKMSSILSGSGKRIRHYEMEVEEDDDENDISHNNTSLDVSKDSIISTEMKDEENKFVEHRDVFTSS